MSEILSGAVITVIIICLFLGMIEGLSNVLCRRCQKEAERDSDVHEKRDLEKDLQMCEDFSAVLRNTGGLRKYLADKDIPDDLKYYIVTTSEALPHYIRRVQETAGGMLQVIQALQRVADEAVTVLHVLETGADVPVVMREALRKAVDELDALAAWEEAKQV